MNKEEAKNKALNYRESLTGPTDETKKILDEIDKAASSGMTSIELQMRQIPDQVVLYQLKKLDYNIKWVNYDDGFIDFIIDWGE